MSLEEEMTRFQREELFKHNALRNCKQKLAVTVKTTSVPNQVFGDEYIPIEHVLGSNKKKNRLLNPYVLRLRRKLPFQSYKLHRIETVTGIIWGAFDTKRSTFNESFKKHNVPRRKGNVQDWSTKIDTISAFDYGNGIDIINPKLLEFSSKTKPINLDDYDERNHIEGGGKDYYEARLHNYNENFSELKSRHVLSNRSLERINHKRFNKKLNKKEITERNYAFDKNNKNDMVVLDVRRQSTNPSYNINFDWSNNSDNNKDIETEKYFKTQILDNSILGQGNITNEEYELALYKISDPDLWCSAQVQLYEKITSPEGKILWNDLTKHSIASVSTTYPNWSNQDVNIQYKSIEVMTRDDFYLASESLCLIVPMKSGKLGDFIIVPSDDIIALNGQKDVNKRNDNTFGVGETPAIEGSGQVRRRVAVRTSRALIGGNFKKFKIITRGSDRFLKFPHTKPHQTQIDVEVRADDNELVLVGVEIRECTPKLIYASTQIRDGESTLEGPVLFPPRHTQSFRLDLPLTIPVDNAHCTVALVNENEEAVAVRDVKIKRDDRCFCVWHCDCVCLSEDSNLLCRPLSEAQLLAAGLSTQMKSRHIRSVCYKDVMTLNLFVMFVGVLLALLLLGYACIFLLLPFRMIKASLGIIFSCVGSFGLDLLIQTPRKLDQYYEDYLKCRTVVYDDEGWPIHPDTKQRSVRLISKPMEFILNLIFFITLPCLLICDALKKVVSFYNTTEKKFDEKYIQRDTKKCFSSRDVQVRQFKSKYFLLSNSKELHSYIFAIYIW
ncbi:uncharacterized protein LOC113392604 [Vanessa tameamea]|uniref:Uncharacterized protein LOC113392604 n=1 Tax=Vanessa tameamea TaxID=334116 RepID=A0ABM4B002_VANTA